MAFGATLTAEVDAPSSRKARGAFFTPPQMADILCSWALRSSHDRMLDPACGEAEFLLSGMRSLRKLGTSSSALSKQVCGCELHRESAVAAIGRCQAQGFTPSIQIGDFLDTTPTRSFDVVVGNPPYVRFQSIGTAQQKTIGKVATEGGIHISALSSSWVPFVVHSTAFLKRGGRLAFVLPAELLTVNYASSVRAFLLRSFSDITLALFDDRVFPEVQEEVVLLLASGYGMGQSRSVLIRSSKNMDDFSAPVTERFYPRAPTDRWSTGLVQADSAAVLNRLEGNGFCRLGEWGRVRLGSVTGNNGFFTMADEQLDEWGLSRRDVIPISPAGSRHLRNLSFAEEDYAQQRASGKRVWLFYPDDAPSGAAERYIAHGQETGVSAGYKCRNRSPWWRVPLSEKADAFVTYMNDYAPQMCANYAGVYHLNSVHGIVFSDDLRNLGKSLLPLACINSATLLSSEIEGRSYGGGVLKVEPREAARLLVPSPEMLKACERDLEAIRGQVQEALFSGDLVSACSLVDEVFIASVSEYSKAAATTLQTEKKKLYERRRSRGRKR